MDKRTDYDRKLWDVIGPPLYYSDTCKLAVKVEADGCNVTITRPCGDCNCQVIAPRKAIATGKGGASVETRIKLSWWRLKALLTGRCA